MKIVADVSAIIPHLLYQDQETSEIIYGENELYAPVLYLSECGNTLLKYLNKNLITYPETVKYMDQSRELISHFIYLDDHSDRIIQIAHEYHLTFYDSEYLFLTLAIKGKLFSRDKKLNEAALSLGIKI